MKLEVYIQKDVSHVTLIKDENYPLGIRLRDGRHDEAGPVIKKIKTRSLAERCHAVAEGDVILSINGQEVMGLRGKDIQWMLKGVEPSIDLKVQYEIQEAYIFRSGVYRKQEMTVRLQKVGDSFGFVLRKKDSNPPFAVEYPIITNVKSENPINKNNQMQDGDRLLKVDNIRLSWLSLSDIAAILQEKVEAEFTFEYNVKVIDFPRSYNRIDLVIDIPNTDIGIGLCTHPENSCEICIGSICQGSIAQRCGVFCKGDIILSVNGTDTESLSVSEANSLLRHAQKNRSISFISTKGRNLSSIALHGKYCTPRESAETSVSSIDAQASDHKHLNSPASSDSTTLFENNHPNELCHREQVKTINMFRDIMKLMTGLKQNLSQLTRDAFDDRDSFNMATENCTLCSTTHHSIKLCVSCLSKMNVKCVESTDVLRNIIAHFISVSTNQGNLLPPEDARNIMSEDCENFIGNGVSRKLIHALTAILPNVFTELQKSFQALAKRIDSTVKTSCKSCQNDTNSISVNVQKLLLLISMNDYSEEIGVLINRLVDLILEAKFTCERRGFSDDSHSSPENECSSESGSSDDPHSSPENECSSQSGSSDPPLCSKDGDSSSKSEMNISQNIIAPPPSETESNEDSSNVGVEHGSLTVNINKESALFRISDERKFSESDVSNSANEVDETSGLSSMNRNVFHADNAAASEMNILENSLTLMSSEASKKNKNIYKDKVISPKSAKLWRSLDSCLNIQPLPIRSAVDENGTSQNSNHTDNRNSNEGNILATEISFTNPQPHSSSIPDPNHHSRINKRNDSDSNTDSVPSSFRDSEQTNGPARIDKIRKETVDVKMVNDGNGFGFVMGFCTQTFSQTLPIPVITAVKPKSPAEKIGILQKNDRVLAINHQSIVGMPLKELESLKRRVFNSDNVTLTIEFDVIDTPLKFGIFEVVVQKRTLKIGLIFQEMKKGSPAVVSGVVKGSAAYRSGQLFPGDKVMFLKLIRNEEFDPISCNYEKEETVQIKIHRNPNETIEEDSSKSSQSHPNPFSYNPRSNLRSGANFIIKRTSIRSAEGTESLVLDQEVTLFRDTVRWDYGFLVGEDPQTGRAYVTDVRPGGPASASGVIKKFDRIVEVNGVAVGKSEECSVLSLLTQANNKMDLLIRRHYHEDMNNATLKPRDFKGSKFM